MKSVDSFDPSRYPREYVASVGWKIFLGLFGGGVGLTLPALAVWMVLVAPSPGRHLIAVLALFAMCAIPSIFLVYSAVSVFRYKVVLAADAIEQTGSWRPIRVERNEILGYRMMPGPYGLGVLQLKTQSTGTKKIPLWFRPDELFVSWFGGLDNVDRDEIAAAMGEIEQDESLGATPQERLQRVQQARKLAQVATWSGIAVAFWFLLNPRPYLPLLFAMLAMPWTAIIGCFYSRVFTISDGGRNTVKADLSRLLLMPGFLLMLRAIQDVHLVDWTGLIVPSLAGSLVMTLLLTNVAPVIRFGNGKALIYLALLLPYWGSAIAMSDVVFDQKPAHRYAATIVSKRFTTGKGASQYFTVSLWPGTSSNREITVSRSLYRTHGTGQSICIHLHDGAVNLAWYEVGAVETCG